MRINIRLLDKPGQLTVVSGHHLRAARQRHRGAPLPGLLARFGDTTLLAHAGDPRAGARRGDPGRAAGAGVPGRPGLGPPAGDGDEALFRLGIDRSGGLSVVRAHRSPRTAVPPPAGLARPRLGRAPRRARSPAQARAALADWFARGRPAVVCRGGPGDAAARRARRHPPRLALVRRHPVHRGSHGRRTARAPAPARRGHLQRAPGLARLARSTWTAPPPAWACRSRSPARSPGSTSPASRTS